MKHWRELLEKLLLSGKYIWHPLPAEVNLDELHGLNDEMGYLDHVTDFIYEVEKKAYKAGFAEGVLEVIKETGEGDMKGLVFDESVNQITAERKYLKWRE